MELIKNLKSNNEINIIWDFDGTLFDTYNLIATAMYTAIKENYKTEIYYDEIMALMLQSIGYSITEIAKKINTTVDDLKKNFKKYYDEIDPSQQLPYPSAREICEFIINNNGNNYINTHRSSNTLNEILEKNNFNNLIKYSVTSDNNFPSKPSPESFNHIVEKFSLNKNKTLVVGDRLLDTQGALNAGLIPVFIHENTRYVFEDDEINQEGTIIFEKLSDFYDFLKNI